SIATMVHADNLDQMADLEELVRELGATEWGMHTVFRVGRAKKTPHLILSHDEKEYLLAFTHKTRTLFPVNLGDEIGYLGYREPLLRDEPFFCGAGKTQCVISPSGDVFPCTTTDSEHSQGNIFDTPLDVIWREGFSAFRLNRLAQKCGKCDYSEGCGGGCWLQSLSSDQCEKEHWLHKAHMPKKLGLAIAMGLAACTSQAKEERPSLPEALPKKPVAKTIQRPAFKAPPKQKLAGTKDALETLLVEYLKQLTMRHHGNTPALVLSRIKTVLREDPAAELFLRTLSPPAQPPTIASLAKEVHRGLSTNQRSMTFGVVVFKYFMEGIAGAKSPEKRTEKEQQLVRSTLNLLRSTLSVWREQIIERKLTVFVTRPKQMIYRSFMSKAGPRPHHGHYAITRNNVVLTKIFQQRYGLRREPPVTKTYLKAWPLGKSLELLGTLSEEMTLKENRTSSPVKGRLVLSIFSTLTTPPLTSKTHSEPKITFLVMGRSWTVTLPRDASLTWYDLITLLYTTHGAALEKAYRSTGFTSATMYSEKILLLRTITDVYNINIRRSKTPNMFHFHKFALWLF
ncbi:radical SAM protein, partial [Myxococcota bacterium]|nr:radical SAM protein [Myxococcota bacterium]